MRIYKWQLEITDKQVISLPVSRKILSVQAQTSAICLWAAVEIESATEQVEIYMIGTGFDIPDDVTLRYLDTVQIHGFVWHVFIKEGGK